MTIGEVARRMRMRPSALRYYEDVGILPRAVRSSGRRAYDAHVLRRLAVIEVAKQAGFTIGEIRVLLSGFPPATAPSVRWRSLAGQKLREVDALIARARKMKQVLEAGLRCGCLRLNDCEVLARHMRAESAAQGDDGRESVRSRGSSSRRRKTTAGARRSRSSLR